MSLESLLTGFGGMVGKAYENRQNQKAIDKARRQQFEVLNSLDWEPTYASETVPQYQKTQSPLARSYIESRLMGNNPDAISPVSPNAGARKVQAQTQQNAMFGTPDERLQQQRLAETQNPYAFKTPQKPVMSAQNQAAAFTGEHPAANGWGIDQDLYGKLVSGGFVKEGDDINTALRGATGIADGNSGRYSAALKNALEAGDSGAVNLLLHPNKNGFAVAPRIRDRKQAKKVRRALDRYDGED